MDSMDVHPSWQLVLSPSSRSQPWFVVVFTLLKHVKTPLNIIQDHVSNPDLSCLFLQRARHFLPE